MDYRQRRARFGNSIPLSPRSHQLPSFYVFSSYLHVSSNTEKLRSFTVTAGKLAKYVYGAHLTLVTQWGRVVITTCFHIIVIVSIGDSYLSHIRILFVSIK